MLGVILNPFNSDIAKHSFEIISSIMCKAICSLYTKELEVLKSKNVKSFFKYVNTWLNPRYLSPQLQRPSNQDQIINDLADISKKLKNFYRSVYSQDVNIKPPNFIVLIHAPIPAVILDPIKMKRIFLSIKSSGPENIYPKILKT